MSISSFPLHKPTHSATSHHKFLNNTFGPSFTMVQNTITTADFSFQAIHHPMPACLEISSSLWRVPSEGSLVACDGGSGKDARTTTRDEEEEKMDRLWEKFNDESHNECGVRKTEEQLDRSWEPEGVVMVCRYKKPNLFLLLKVLRKFFLPDNSHNDHS